MSATLHAKLFLQSLLSRPSLSLPQALAIFSSTALAAHSYDPDLPEPPPKAERDTRWNAFRHELNGQLEPLGMEIRQVLDEGDKGWWVVLVNTEADDLAQLATVYTPLELAYLKTLIRAIVLAPSYAYSVSRLQASRLASALPNHPSSALTRAGAEALVERFVSGGWLEVSKHKKRLSLTCRTTTELEGYFEKEFPPGIDEDEDEDDGRPRVLKCGACKAIVTKGKVCPACPVDHPTAIHHHCLHKLLVRASASSRSSSSSSSQAAKKPKKVHCPAQGETVEWTADAVDIEGDRTEWTEVGEAAAGDKDDGYVPRRRASASGKAKKGVKGKGKGKRARGSGSESEEEEDVESEEEDSEGESIAPAKSSTARHKSSRTASASPPKRVVKGKGKKKVRVDTPSDDDDVDDASASANSEL